MSHHTARPRSFSHVYISFIALAALALVALSFRPLSGKLGWWLWDRGYFAAAYYVNYGDAALAMDEGSYYFGNGAYDLNKAEQAYLLALSLQPGILWGHYQLGRILFVEGDFARAKDQLNAELAANPGNMRALYERGLVEESTGNLAASESDFRHFVAWAPTEWAGYNDLAFILAKEGKYAESAATVEQAFNTVPGGTAIPWLWNSLGVAQLNELHYGEAHASFAKALALAQKLTPAEWARAYSANDPAAAMQGIANFQAAIRANLNTAQTGLAL